MVELEALETLESRYEIRRRLTLHPEASDMRFHPRKSLAQVALALLAVAALGAAELQAQHDYTLSYGHAEDVGMSPSVLAGAVGLYQEAVERGDLVGAVILIVRKGRVVVHEAVGMRDQELGLPMERNTMFRMASNTKPLIATAIAQLVEKGKLSYTDLVRERIPEWDNYRAGFITIGQLLSHSSGLRIPTLFLRPLMEATAEHRDAPTLQLEAARFGEIGAAVPPGEAYRYSNPGYNTLAALVEIASGKLLED